MSASPNALSIADALLAQLEGFRSAPYLDTHGLWTIGYGSRFLANGAPVTSTTDAIDRAEGDRLLIATLDGTAADLAEMVTVPLVDHEWGGLLSFVFNIGLAAFHGSTVRRDLNAGDKRAASDHFADWDKVYDPHTHRLVVSAGLVRRRKLERATFTGLTVPHVQARPMLDSTAALNDAELGRVEG